MDIFSLLHDKIELKGKIRMFEAFSGIGCQAMALKRVTDNYEIVGFSEIDKYAIQSYRAIHGEHIKNYGDITKMTEIPECDIFTWSFPCTDLSKAGKQAGMNVGTRSGLVYEVLRLVRDTKIKPKVLIMENVVDLIQVKFSRQFGEIQLEFERMGYMNYVEVLNAKDYGVAQNRERVFMVSILGEYSYEFPKREKLVKRLKDYLEPVVDEKYYLSDKMLGFFLENSKNNEEKGNGFRFKPHEIDDSTTAYAITTNTGSRMDDNFVKIPEATNQGYALAEDTDGISTAITTAYLPSVQVLEPKIGYALGSREFAARGWMDEAPTLCARDYKDPKVVMIQEATNQGYALAEDGDGVYINRPHQNRGVVQKGMIQTIKTNGDDVGVVVESGYSKYSANKIVGNIVEENDVVGTITASAMQSFNHDNCHMIKQQLRIRKLTPRECGRLMDVSDDDIDKMVSVVSNSQMYKQFGNGIVVSVFERILKEIVER